LLDSLLQEIFESFYSPFPVFMKEAWGGK